MIDEVEVSHESHEAVLSKGFSEHAQSLSR